jgi:chromosomal replication initiation ATPase DnaA
MMTGLELFEKRVLEDLWREICDVFPEDNRPPPTPLEIEGEKHDDFKLLHSRTFVGRNEELAQLYAFADGSEDGPLVIHGPSGIGKSALLATFCKRYSKDRPGVSVLPHFVSASSISSDICHLLRRVCEEIKKSRKIPEELIMEY